MPKERLSAVLESLHPASLLRSRLGVLLSAVFALTAVYVATIMANPAEPARAVLGNNVSSNIRLLDTNANGKIDRITLDIANPSAESWHVQGVSPYGVSVTQGGNDITISSVVFSGEGSANPAVLFVNLSEADPDLGVNTAVGTTELIYTPVTGDQTCNNCIQDGVDEELNAIATGDTNGTDTEIDAAAPVLTQISFEDLGSTGRINFLRGLFSEDIVTGVFNLGDHALTNAGEIIWEPITTIGGEGNQYSVSVNGPVSVSGATGGVLPTYAYTNNGDFIQDAAGNITPSFGPVNVQDNMDPFLISVSPAKDAVDVSPTANVVLTFSEELDPDVDPTFNDGDIAIYAGPDKTGNAYTFTHAASPWPDGLITMTLTGGEDRAGNAVNAGAIGSPWSFTVAAPAAQRSSNFLKAYQEQNQQLYEQQQQEAMDAQDGDSSDDTADGTDTEQSEQPADGTDEPDDTQEEAAREALRLTFHEQDPAPASPLPENVAVGSLVKAEGDSAVYFIDNDNRRHAFPNALIYSSWFEDFSGVQTVSSSVLAGIQLGSNMTMRPGTWLIKIVSSNRVYAIEPYGVIRWVQTEAVAADLYGPDWADRVVDISDVFFTDYQEGEPLAGDTLPNGAVVRFGTNADTYYVGEGALHMVDAATFAANFFQERFVVAGVSEQFMLPPGTALPSFGIDVLVALP